MVVNAAATETMTDHGAFCLREDTGTSSLEQTARSVAEVLCHHGIAHLIVGGLALQEHGYYRTTTDVDVVVGDVFEAVDVLTADLSGPFRPITGRQDGVRDRRNDAVVDVLPGGQVVKAGCKVPFPMPTEVTDRPKVVGLPDLISLKLDSWANSPTNRLKDKADVVELIKARTLPRDFAVLPQVRLHYEETWDALKAEV